MQKRIFLKSDSTLIPVFIPHDSGILQDYINQILLFDSEDYAALSKPSDCKVYTDASGLIGFPEDFEADEILQEVFWHRLLDDWLPTPEELTPFSLAAFYDSAVANLCSTKNEFLQTAPNYLETIGLGFICDKSHLCSLPYDRMSALSTGDFVRKIYRWVGTPYLPAKVAGNAAAMNIIERLGKDVHTFSLEYKSSLLSDTIYDISREGRTYIDTVLAKKIAFNYLKIDLEDHLSVLTLEPPLNADFAGVFY